MTRLLLLPVAAIGVIAIGGSHPAAGPPEGGAVVALALPVRGAVVTQGYGCTAFELEPAAAQCPGGHFHGGLDLAAPLGTPVLAAAGGVAAVSDGWSGYGLHVVVSHGGGLTTLYAHLDSATVATGDLLSAGQVLGRVGSSGLSTGPHLHFEVRRNGRPVDPAPFLPAASQEVRSWSTRSFS